MPRVQIASCSEPGARSRNEDNLRCGVAQRGSYAVLADGAGGHSRGAEAALLAVTGVENMLRDAQALYSPAYLTRAVRQAHAQVQSQQGAATPEARMHCTVVALWIDLPAQHALWTHVGDSRLYRVRRGRTDVVTADDSVVQRLLKTGAIQAEQVPTHPQKNQLLAALGVAGEVVPHTVVRPVEVQEGDAFLLCSDGWWEHFDPHRLATVLAQAVTPQGWLDLMRQHIVAQAKPRQDNFSAIALWAGDPAEAFDSSADDTQPGLGWRQGPVRAP